ncbi:MAG: HAMP domain-containing histidine kinase [Myxococcales bacterium]|nr:HAMP domain-containing histidine kinase [Myxococcales bacterium]
MLPAALLAAFALAFTIAILVGWSLIFTRYYIVATNTKADALGVGYWLLLVLGCVFLVMVVLTLIYLLVSNVRRSRLVQQQTTFIDGVTHELRSPLASLLLAIDTLDTRRLDDEQRARFIATMRDDIDRLRTLVEHVLAAARLEHEEQELDYREFSPRELGEECATAIRRRYKLPERAITVEVADDLRVISDPVALTTIANNLLDNAVKYSRDNVAVTMNITFDDMLRVAVRDQGIGLTSAQRKRVFGRFYRVRHSDTAPVRGTGLGLYVVRALARRLGGDVDVESDGQGQGSCFTLRVPAQLPSHPAAAAATTASASTGETRKEASR